MPDDKLQDDEQAKIDLRDQARLETERAAWDSSYREIDELYPDGAGGFNMASPGRIRGERLYDPTHLLANGRFAAAGLAITTPEQTQYIVPRFADPELMKLRSVQQWCTSAGPRLYAMRHALHTGFVTAASEDWDQLGRYGTSPVWADAKPGRGLFYRALHLSTCWIDVDFAGLVNRVHRKLKLTADQLADMFDGKDSLTPKMQKALEENKGATEFELLHVVAPNPARDREKLDWRAMPVVSRYLAIDEKIYLKRAGFHSMPISVSRHLTSPGEKYGRSPAMQTAPTVSGLQAMRHTTLRAAHKAVDPALAFNNDDNLTSIATKPGGLIPGLMSSEGQLLIGRVPGGEQGLPYAENETERERNTVKQFFLEEFFKLLTDPNSRMTTTEVLEVMSKQGALARPFASRYATEKQHPMSQRELELAFRFKQLPELPPEVQEAGAWPTIEYENPLAAMARAEKTGRTLRFGEYATQIGTLAQTPAAEILDFEAMLRGGAEEIGVDPSYLLDPETVAAGRKAKADTEQAAIDAKLLESASGSAVDLAKANQIAEAA